MGSKVVVTRSKLDLLADSVSAKSGESLPLTIGEMKVAVDSIVLNSTIIGDGELNVDENDYLYFEDDGEGGSGTAAISVVDTIDSNGGTIREITALDISDTTAIASDVSSGKYFYTAQGIKTAGTGSGGTPSATAHTIYFEFSDNTNTTITAYYDDSFISNAITATTPTTYGQKTVTLAELDGVAWYNPSNIPLNTQLVDYTAIKGGYVIDGSTGEEIANGAGFSSDYIVIDPTMTFTYVGYEWWDAAFYDSSKTFISGFVQNTYADSIESDAYAHGTLTPARIPANAMYIRLTGYPNDYYNSTTMSLIRTA